MFHILRLALMLLHLVVLLVLSSHLLAKDKPVNVGLSVWSGYPDSVKGFKAAMKDGGFIAGESVHYVLGNSGGDKTKQKKIAQQFKAANVDLVYSLTTPGTVIIKETLPASTPIIFSIVTYPADSGLIESFEYSGNNLVGTSNYVPLHHHVNLLQALLPKAKTVAIFHRKGEPNSQIQTASLSRHFKRKGIKVLDQTPSTLKEVTTMATALIGHIDAFVTTTDTLMQSGGEAALIKISLANKIPILSSNKAGIENGATFGPVADFYTLGKMSGDMAVKVLRDKIEPTRLESQYQEPPITLLNKSSVEALGIQVPDSVRKRSKWIN